MNRTTLFHVSMGISGTALGIDAVVAVLTGSLTPTRGVTVAAAGLIVATVVYSLARPERTDERTDSWLAYVAAIGAILVTAGVAVTWV